MKKKNRPAGNLSRDTRLGSLGEKLLAAGVKATPREQGEPKKDAQEKRRKSTRKEAIFHEIHEKVPIEDSARTEKQRKKNEKARRRNEQKGKKSSLLRIIERQNERKKTIKVGTAAIFGDPSTPALEMAPDNRYSIQKVQDTLRSTAEEFKLHRVNNESNLVTASDKEGMLDRLSAFEEIRPLLSFDEAADIELVLGFDFGSTSSKIVCRFPYDEGLGAYAVPTFDSLSAEDHPYYWRTLLWEDGGGTFELTPQNSSRRHDHLKLAFLRSARNSSKTITEEMVYVTAYLALMIRQSLGWLWQRVGPAVGRNSIGISVNFGFPTEKGGKSPQLNQFQICARIALRIALSNSAVTRSNLQNAFHSEFDRSEDAAVRTLVVPEFIGAVMGYFHSAQKKNGQFMICDIGGLTIDAVCFGFYQTSEGRTLIKIYGSSVSPFGSEIAKISVDEGIPKESLATAIGSFLCGPIKDSHEKTGYNAPAWGGEMPLFVIGGGRHYEGYSNAFSEAERLIKNSWFKTSFRKLELDLNEELDISRARGRSCGRLLVAWGLSHSDLDLPEWLARRDLPDGPKLRKVDMEDIFVGKEQT